MAIKQYKPTSAGRRGMSVIDYSELDKVEPLDSLTVTLPKHAGRNNHGGITVRHQGGGNRKKYRLIDWKRDKKDIPGVVESIEFDPFASPYRPRAMASQLAPVTNAVAAAPTASAPAPGSDAPSPLQLPLAFETAVADFETRLLRQALEEGRYNQRKAAELLQLTYHQFRGLLRKYKLLDGE